MGLPGLYQLDAMRGPQRQHARLNGVRMADVGFRGVQVLAGRDRRRPEPADGIHAPTAAGLSGGSPARTIGLPIKVTLVS
jgi:hypothetical protein